MASIGIKNVSKTSYFSFGGAVRACIFLVGSARKTDSIFLSLGSKTLPVVSSEHPEKIKCVGQKPRRGEWLAIGSDEAPCMFVLLKWTPGDLGSLWSQHLATGVLDPSILHTIGLEKSPERQSKHVFQSGDGLCVVSSPRCRGSDVTPCMFDLLKLTLCCP